MRIFLEWHSLRPCDGEFLGAAADHDVKIIESSGIDTVRVGLRKERPVDAEGKAFVESAFGDFLICVKQLPRIPLA